MFKKIKTNPVVLVYPALIVLGVIFLLFVIINKHQKTNKQSPTNTSSRSRKSNIDILRSLPYAGSVKIEEDAPSGVVFIDKDKCSLGYNLYSIRPLCMAELIDLKGNVINSWRYDGSEFWSWTELLPNGDLLAIGGDAENIRPGDPNTYAQHRYLLRFNWDGKLLWRREIAAHHDVELTSDGSMLVLTLRYELNPSFNYKIKLCDNQITQLDQKGNIIESHSIYEAVSAGKNIFPLEPVELMQKNKMTYMDLFHCNSLEKMHIPHLVGKHPIYDLDNILVCFRHQNRIAVFSWKENKVIWAWGQDQLSGPHDASVLDNGNILIFDNGLGKGYSRVIELDPVKKTIIWEYKDNPPTNFYTAARGSAQRLSNGNTLIAESDKGHAFEITSDGKIVWEFFCPHKVQEDKRATIVRMKKYSPQFINNIINSQ
ncbi:MAG: aryl-sulfate sulfotransferase [Candidatus Heimdallarchaeota archaeon]|nr:aryl-sulfate sulfotransferase [Candidatus Heimdallarchaeota archaeon]